jgi:hypothetical protein
VTSSLGLCVVWRDFERTGGTQCRRKKLSGELTISGGGAPVSSMREWRVRNEIGKLPVPQLNNLVGGMRPGVCCLAQYLSYSDKENLT